MASDAQVTLAIAFENALKSVTDKATMEFPRIREVFANEFPNAVRDMERLRTAIAETVMKLQEANRTFQEPLARHTVSTNVGTEGISAALSQILAHFDKFSERSFEGLQSLEHLMKGLGESLERLTKVPVRPEDAGTTGSTSAGSNRPWWRW
jgi:hypothetical protein